MSSLNDIQQSVAEQIKRDLADKSDLELKSLMIAGLSEEAGEVAGLYKRELRNLSADAKRCTLDCFRDELGDVLWYLAGVAYTRGLTLQEIWNRNVEKLEERYGS